MKQRQTALLVLLVGVAMADLAGCTVAHHTHVVGRTLLTRCPETIRQVLSGESPEGKEWKADVYGWEPVYFAYGWKCRIKPSGVRLTTWHYRADLDELIDGISKRWTPIHVEKIRRYEYKGAIDLELVRYTEVFIFLDYAGSYIRFDVTDETDEVRYPRMVYRGPKDVHPAEHWDELRARADFASTRAIAAKDYDRQMREYRTKKSKRDRELARGAFKSASVGIAERNRYRSKNREKALREKTRALEKAMERSKQEARDKMNRQRSEAKRQREAAQQRQQQQDARRQQGSAASNPSPPKVKCPSSLVTCKSRCQNDYATAQSGCNRNCDSSLTKNSWDCTKRERTCRKKLRTEMSECTQQCERSYYARYPQCRQTGATSGTSK